MTEQSPTTQSIKLSWQNSFDIPSTYANALMAAHSGNEFYLIFGEVQLPFGEETTELSNSLEVRPLVKIVLTPDSMVRFLEVMQDNIQKFERHQSEIGD